MHTLVPVYIMISDFISRNENAKYKFSSIDIFISNYILLIMKHSKKSTISLTDKLKTKTSHTSPRDTHQSILISPYVIVLVVDTRLINYSNSPFNCTLNGGDVNIDVQTSIRYTTLLSYVPIHTDHFASDANIVKYTGPYSIP